MLQVKVNDWNIETGAPAVGNVSHIFLLCVWTGLNALNEKHSLQHRKQVFLNSFLCPVFIFFLTPLEFPITVGPFQYCGIHWRFGRMHTGMIVMWNAQAAIPQGELHSYWVLCNYNSWCGQTAVCHCRRAVRWEVHAELNLSSLSFIPLLATVTEVLSWLGFSLCQGPRHWIMKCLC